MMLTVLPAQVQATSSTGSETQRDIILMLDVSGSMWGEPLTVMKEAAVKFCYDIMENEDDNRIALIIWNYRIEGVYEFSDDIEGVANIISDISPGGGTKTDLALQTAKDLMDETARPDAAKNIILMTDGLPIDDAFGYSGPYTYDDYYNYDCANSAWSVAQNIMEQYNLYTLGFFHSLDDDELEFGRKFLTDIQNAGFYEVVNADDLEFAFGDLADDITDENTNYPIVVVPGVMGSRLYSDEAGTDRIWEPSTGSAIWQAINPFASFRDTMTYGKTVYLKNNGINQVTAANREYGAQDTYKELIDTLCETYPDREIYFFSYDFREDNAGSAKELNKLIESVVGAQGTKVDIVCHSMGGLVTSSYVAQYGSERINQVVTFGTPYEGAPKLVNAVLNWDVLTNRYEDDELLDVFNKSTISDTVLGLGGLTKTVKAGFPAIAQLAPTQTLFNEFDYCQRHKSGALWWATQSDDEISYTEYQEIMGNIFGSNFEAAESFHSSIKNNADINVLAALDNSYFVVGINHPTVVSLIFNEGDSLSSLECVDLVYEYDGDGTVPYYSANMITSINKLNGRYLEVDDTHTGIVSNSKALNWLTDILSSGNSNVSNDAVDTSNYVVVRIACPVEVEIERDGEVLSSDLKDASFTTSFGQIDLTGQDADIKMLCLRADEIDTLELSGTDEGEMDMSLRWFNEDGQLTDERVFSDIPLTSTMLLTTTTDNTGDTVLSIDKDGDGQTDSTVTVGVNSTVSPSISVPTASVKSGTYQQSVTVELTSEAENGEIYYTTDGTAPTKQSSLYRGPITISTTTELRAVTYVDDMCSDVMTHTYVITTNDNNESSNEQVHISPQTGDDSMLTVWIVLALMSLAGIAAVVLYRHKIRQ